MHERIRLGGEGTAEMLQALLESEGIESRVTVGDAGLASLDVPWRDARVEELISRYLREDGRPSE